MDRSLQVTFIAILMHDSCMSLKSLVSRIPSVGALRQIGVFPVNFRAVAPVHYYLSR